MNMETTHSTYQTIRPHGRFTEEPVVNNAYVYGYVVLAMSTILYTITELGIKHSRSDDYLLFFVVHYFLAVAYVVYLLINRSYGFIRSWKPEHLDKTI